MNKAPETRREFALLYSDGIPLSEIAIKLRSARSTLIRWREEMNLPKRSEEKTPLRIEFETLYRSTNLGYATIAKQLGIPWNQAKKWRKATGLPAKKAKHNTNPRKKSWRDLWAGLIPEYDRERKALISIDQAWSRHPAARKKKSAEEEREYGRKAAALRYARYSHTAEFKIHASARNAVARIARMTGSRRAPRTRTFEFLGCSYDFARRYLEVRFLPGMTWENYGTEWHIDHVKPLASFDLMKIRHRRRAMHYTNLQPLWGPDNLTKHAKVETQQTFAL